MSSNAVFANVRNNKKGNSGRKWRSRKEIKAKIQSTPFVQSGTIRALSNAANVPKFTLYDLLNEKSILQHTSLFKPTSSSINKLRNVIFALYSIHSKPRSGQMVFSSILNYVQVDENWFYKTKERENYY